MRLGKTLWISFCTVGMCFSFFTTRVNAPIIEHEAFNSHPKLSFSVISDIHLREGKSNSGTTYHDRIADHRLLSALTDIYDINPHQDALVIDGDCTTTGSQSDYARVRDILNKIPHPTNTLFAIGNHEFSSALYKQNGVFSPRTFPNGVTEQACIELFNSTFAE
ncbi:hypothetical protein GCM10025859_50000 [Alicyclobacillus fastidiosus]|nr:hypothetical protein GCM10025859_50000 [Alicyclobacillus fastidiosus]